MDVAKSFGVMPVSAAMKLDLFFVLFFIAVDFI
jgi:hypothetical protein